MNSRPTDEGAVERAQLPYGGWSFSDLNSTPAATELSAEAEAARHQRRYSWAELLKRVFAVDVLECLRCHGRMRILCAIHPPEAIWGILACGAVRSRPAAHARAVRRGISSRTSR